MPPESPLERHEYRVTVEVELRGWVEVPPRPLETGNEEKDNEALEEWGRKESDAVEAWVKKSIEPAGARLSGEFFRAANEIECLSRRPDR